MQLLIRCSHYAGHQKIAAAKQPSHAKQASKQAASSKAAEAGM